MLKGLVTLTTSGGKFPDMAQQLKFFQTSFNHDQAKKAGVIVPSPGVDASYDTAISQIKATEHEFQEYLTRQRKKLGCKVCKCTIIIILILYYIIARDCIWYNDLLLEHRVLG